MRILYYSSSSFVDADLPLLKAMADAGNEVIYLLQVAPFSKNSPLFSINQIKPESGIFPTEDYPQLSIIDKYVKRGNAFVLNDSVGKLKSIRNSFRLVKMLKSFVQQVSPDIVHIVETPYELYFLAIRDYKQVITVHDPFPHSGEKTRRKAIIRRVLFGKADGFILLNDRENLEFARHFKIPEEKIHNSKLGQYDCIKEFGKGKRRYPFRYILLQGRISPYKGIEYAIQAMDSISEVNDVKLVIAGSGDIYFDLNKYNLSNVVIDNRYITVDEIADNIRFAEFVLAPYTDATQSGVIQTAFALGKPVVATKVGNFDQVIKDGINGFLVPPCDSGSLAESMVKMLQDDSLREQMGRNIMTQNECSEWDAIVSTYGSAYSEILKNRDR